MATRIITTDLWGDQKWRRELENIRVRYFWLYLLTCPNSKTCGIFYLPMDEVVLHTKLSEDECWQYLNELIANKMCLYSQETEEIAIFNYPKYNVRNSGTPITDMLKRELSQVKSKTLIDAMVSYMYDYSKKIVGKKKETLKAIFDIYKSFSLRERDIEIEINSTLTNTNTNTYTDTDTDTELNKKWDTFLNDLEIGTNEVGNDSKLPFEL